MAAIGAVAAGTGDDEDEPRAATGDTTTTERRNPEFPPSTDAPTTTTTEPAGPQSYPMGTPVQFEIEDFDGATSVIEVIVANNRIEDPEFSDPMIVVDVTVSMAAGGEAVYSANPFNFKLVLADGTVREVGCCLEGPQMESTDLSAGQRITGPVPFSGTAEEMAGARVQLDDIGEDLGQPLAFWAM